MRKQFENLYQTVNDPESRREITLALGKAKKSHWRRPRRQGWRFRLAGEGL